MGRAGRELIIHKVRVLQTETKCFVKCVTNGRLKCTSEKGCFKKRRICDTGKGKFALEIANRKGDATTEFTINDQNNWTIHKEIKAFLEEKLAAANRGNPRLVLEALAEAAARNAKEGQQAAAVTPGGPSDAGALPPAKQPEVESLTEADIIPGSRIRVKEGTHKGRLGTTDKYLKKKNKWGIQLDSGKKAALTVDQIELSNVPPTAPPAQKRTFAPGDTINIIGSKYKGRTGKIDKFFPKKAKWGITLDARDDGSEDEKKPKKALLDASLIELK